MKKSLSISFISILLVAVFILGILLFMNNHEKTYQINALNEDLTKKNTQINTLEADVAGKAAQIDTLNAYVTDKAAQIDEMKADLANKAAQIDTLKADIAGKAEQIETLNAYLTDKTAQIETLNAYISDKTVQIDILNACITDNTEQIHTLEEDAADKAAQIDTLKADVTNKAVQIDTLKAAAADKAAQIDSLKADAADKAAQIDSLKADVVDKTAQIDTLKADVANKAMQIDTLKSDVADKAAQIEALKVDKSAQTATLVLTPTDNFYVNDAANVLSDETENHIILNNNVLYTTCGAQIVFVTLDTTGTTNLENYAYKLFNRWKIGGTKNYGFLLVMVINDDDYWYEIGSGLDQYLTATDAGKLIDEYLEPLFAQHDYDGGARALYDALCATVASALNATTPADLTDEVQDRLIGLGWLDASQRTGVFDNATLLALSNFQCYMNSINKDVMLPTNGYPDDLTMTWLRWTNAPSRPAVIESTPEPPLDEIMLSADSSEEDISAFKQKLSQLGWLDAGADINGLYDEALTEAVTQLKFWLLDNWDETLYGERPEWTEISGGSVDWQTMRVVIDETNPPMKPAGYDPW